MAPQGEPPAAAAAAAAAMASAAGPDEGSRARRGPSGALGQRDDDSAQNPADLGRNPGDSQAWLVNPAVTAKEEKRSAAPGLKWRTEADQVSVMLW